MYEYVMAGLQATKGKWPQVAAESGLSKRTFEKVAQGIIENPSVHLCQALHDYFRAREAAGTLVVTPLPRTAASAIKPAASSSAPG